MKCVYLQNGLIHFPFNLSTWICILKKKGKMYRSRSDSIAIYTNGGKLCELFHLHRYLWEFLRMWFKSDTSNGLKKKRITNITRKLVYTTKTKRKTVDYLFCISFFSFLFFSIMLLLFVLYLCKNKASLYHTSVYVHNVYVCLDEGAMISNIKRNICARQDLI